MKTIRFAFAFIVISIMAYAEETEERGPGIYSDVGIGGGVFYAGYGDTWITTPAVSLETRLGAHINDNVSVFFLSHISAVSISTAGAFANWIFEDEELIAVKAPLILVVPFVAMIDSEICAGPGIAYRTSPNAPSIYVEGGCGYFSFQSLAYRAFVFGIGLFAGIGVEITDEIGVGLRLVYAPSATHSGWTPSRDQHLSIGALIYF